MSAVSVENLLLYRGGIKNTFEVNYHNLELQRHLFPQQTETKQNHFWQEKVIHRRSTQNLAEQRFYQIDSVSRNKHSDKSRILIESTSIVFIDFVEKREKLEQLKDIDGYTESTHSSLWVWDELWRNLDTDHKQNT